DLARLHRLLELGDRELLRWPSAEAVQRHEVRIGRRTVTEVRTVHPLSPFAASDPAAHPVASPDRYAPGCGEKPMAVERRAIDHLAEDRRDASRAKTLPAGEPGSERREN